VPRLVSRLILGSVVSFSFPHSRDCGPFYPPIICIVCSRVFCESPGFVVPTPEIPPQNSPQSLRSLYRLVVYGSFSRCRFFASHFFRFVTSGQFACFSWPFLSSRRERAAACDSDDCRVAPLSSFATSSVRLSGGCPGSRGLLRELIFPPSLRLLEADSPLFRYSRRELSLWSFPP